MTDKKKSSNNIGKKKSTKQAEDTTDESVEEQDMKTEREIRNTKTLEHLKEIYSIFCDQKDSFSHSCFGLDSDELNKSVSSLLLSKNLHKKIDEREYLFELISKFADKVFHATANQATHLINYRKIRTIMRCKGKLSEILGIAKESRSSEHFSEVFSAQNLFIQSEILNCLGSHVTMLKMLNTLESSCNGGEKYSIIERNKHKEEFLNYIFDQSLTYEESWDESLIGKVFYNSLLC
jgi:hypothetical protein